MAQNEQQILQTTIEKIASEFKKRIPKGTGETLRSIETKVTENTAQLLGRDFIGSLETGRGPRTTNSDTGFAERLLEWMRAVGIPGANEQKAKQLAYWINKVGTLAHKKGRKTGVISDFNIDQHIRRMKDQLEIRYSDIIVNRIKLDNKNAK